MTTTSPSPDSTDRPPAGSTDPETDGGVRRTLRGVLAAGVALLCGYLLARPWLNNWGATPVERAKALPGDDLIPDPNYQTTRAVTVDAPPEAVWPWLVQLGAGRGGLYSYDWLDIFFGVLDAPSATEIVPEYQHLEAGETIPLGTGGDLVVATLDPARALVAVPEELPAGTLTWAFVLEPLPGGRTRLLTRNRAHVEWSLRWLATVTALEPQAFLMTRKMLLGIKRRAERRG